MWLINIWNQLSTCETDLAIYKNVINYQKTNICTQSTSSSRDPVRLQFVFFALLSNTLTWDGLNTQIWLQELYIRCWYINVHYIDLNKNITIEDPLHRAMYWPMRDTARGIQCIVFEVRKSYYDGPKDPKYLKTIVQIYINIVTEVRTQDVKSIGYARLSIFQVSILSIIKR